LIRSEDYFITRNFGEHFQENFENKFSYSNGKISFFSKNDNNDKEEIAFIIEQDELIENLTWKKFHYKDFSYIIKIKEDLYINSEINSKSPTSGQKSDQAKNFKNAAFSVRSLPNKDDNKSFNKGENKINLFGKNENLQLENLNKTNIYNSVFPGRIQEKN